LNYEAGFYNATYLKVHPPIAGLQEHMQQCQVYPFQIPSETAQSTSEQ
jgi:hypothetical protein